ncbi:MAG: DEAD/DEAH box helicase [Myxococcales bacterium]|nr:DEAD/DEAH box helicase [Myxococcales bacterium]MCB9580521.1 DEAD/DEAH box helicase [Polyangiaceae bacterium]
MPEAPWSHPVGIDAVVSEWLSSGSVRECFTADHTSPAQGATSAPLPQDLAPSLRRALAQRGITELYSHQAQAIAEARAGRHVVLATPTASGKSLCFHLPVLQALSEDPTASALFLYPTKALSRDQEHSLRELITEAELGVAATVYDGDTPGDARRVARERCRIVLTNPDMLHAGILPNHAKWVATFQNLKYVVLDELHTYRGVFGSHMAHVIARLKRIARFHGSDPVFIAATATIGNPREHAARLFGVDTVALVDQSGAPRSSRRLFVYNPPVVNAELGIRASALKQSVNLAATLVRARVPTIVFGPSRNSVEVMLKYLRAKCGDVAGADAIMAYRGGYLPETRRAIERGLREGEILCVVATNALELGIDIGDLDAVVCAGYPGSVAATWQRFGRAGRRGDGSIAVMVCGSSALDQYLARDPSYLLGAPAEEARIDPANVEVLVQHLKCAAFEAPFELSAAGPRPAHPEAAQGEAYLSLDARSTRNALDYLASHGLVHESGGVYHWAGEAFPANHVSLRNIGWDNFVIIDVATDKSIAELDWRAAHTMLHEQAIYQHDAEQFQVERLDYENHKAFVRKVAPDYFTTALTYRTVQVIEEHDLRAFGNTRIGLGDVKVEEKVTGYKKIKFFTHENAGYGDVHLPEIQMHTVSFWLTLPEAVIDALGKPRAAVVDGLRGLGRALETVSTLSLMCDPRDIGQTLGDGGTEGVAPGRDPFGGRIGGFDPTVFLFDAQPGGVGLAPRIFERAGELCDRARALIEGCRCEGGCPACVGPTEDGGSRKRMALDILVALDLRDRSPAPPRALQGSGA